MELPVREERRSSSSAGPLQQTIALAADDAVDSGPSSPLLVKVSVFETEHETTKLHHAPSTLLGETTGDADFPPIQSFGDAKLVCMVETSKLWEIAAPIAFNILCNYGVNSFTSIFVGHIGDLELSAVAIALSVVSNFSFGFLVIKITFSSAFFFSVSCVFSNFPGKKSAAGNGECVGNAMWASVWSGTNGYVRCLYAAFMAYSHRNFLLLASTLHLRNSSSYFTRPRTRNRRNLWQIHNTNHPSNVCVSHQFPDSEVSPVTEQSRDLGLDRFLRFDPSHFHPLPLHKRFQVGAKWCSGCV